MDEDTNKIYFGTVKDLGGDFKFTGKKEDVTKDAVNAVAQYMINEFKKWKCDNYFAIYFNYGDETFTLKIEKEKNNDIR